MKHVKSRANYQRKTAEFTHDNKGGGGKGWVKETGACLFAAALVGMTAFAVAYEPDTSVVEYRHEVQSGETLWKVCADVATDAEDLSELVWRTQKENNLSDAQLSCLTPGMEIVIHPKRMVKPGKR